MLEKFPAYADVGFAPSDIGVGAVAVPLAWMQDYDCSALDGYAFAALELDDALAASDVEKLVFPVGKCTTVLPREVVVRRVVGVGIRLAWFGDLLAGASYGYAELSLSLAYRSVVYFVHGAYYTMPYQIVQVAANCYIDFER